LIKNGSAEEITNEEDVSNIENMFIKQITYYLNTLKKHFDKP
jgi:hypothetical protein